MALQRACATVVAVLLLGTATAQLADPTLVAASTGTATAPGALPGLGASSAGQGATTGGGAPTGLGSTTDLGATTGLGTASTGLSTGTGLGTTGFGSGVGAPGGAASVTGLDAGAGTVGLGAAGTGLTAPGLGGATGLGGVNGLSTTAGLGTTGLSTGTATAAGAAAATLDPSKGQPITVKPGEQKTLVWTTAPPHPDVVMCCGGSLTLTWSPFDGGVDRSVVVNVDATCPSAAANQQYFVRIAQQAPRGSALLAVNQDGDYYISDEAGCPKGMQFLLAVRGCSSANSVYAPLTQLTDAALAPCRPLPPPAANATANATVMQAPSPSTATTQAAGAASLSASALVAAAVSAAALLAL